MKIFADYHTHTVYSHGTGSVKQNADAAKDKGMVRIGISDHGFSHPFYGIKKDSPEKIRRDCAAVSANGFKALVGIECNFIDSRGRCDLAEEDYDKFDIFLAGAHIFAGYKDFSAFWNMCVIFPAESGLGIEPNGKQKAYMTDVYINAVRTQPIDILTHLDYRVFSNVKEVAACCREYGTYIEINTKKTHMTDEQWREVYDVGADFVIGSDAHSPDRVGDFGPAFALMERVGIDPSRVHNLDRLPDFRFARYKGVTV